MNIEYYTRALCTKIKVTATGRLHYIINWSGTYIEDPLFTWHLVIHMAVRGVLIQEPQITRHVCIQCSKLIKSHLMAAFAL